MKKISVKRFIIAMLLFTVGTLSLLCSVGDDDLPLLPFVIAHVGFLLLGIACFISLGHFLRRWDSNPEI